MMTKYSSAERDKAEAKAKRVAAHLYQRMDAVVDVSYDLMSETFTFTLVGSTPPVRFDAALMFVHLANDALLTQALMDGLRRVS